MDKELARAVNHAHNLMQRTRDAVSYAAAISAQDGPITTLLDPVTAALNYALANLPDAYRAETSGTLPRG